jgi:hypothetical protein
MFDWGINQGSMQEMTGETKQSYFDLWKGTANGIYSMNYHGVVEATEFPEFDVLHREEPIPTLPRFRALAMRRKGVTNAHVPA